MKLTEIRKILANYDLQLTKSLGQNFLHDANQLQRIAAAAELNAADKVLEVGPGLGPLTEILLAHAGEVLAIETDHRFATILEGRFEGNPKLQLIVADALAWIRHEQRDWTGWKLVANLPYSVASPILVELALAARPPERLTVTLQLEVARRVAARADDDDYGILTLLVQLAFEPGALFKIPPECFFPVPNVDSACLTLHRRATPLLPLTLTPTFTRIAKRAFSQRRKMMHKLLRTEWPVEKLNPAFDQLGISPQARAETVSLHQFVELTRRLAPPPS